MTIPSVLDEHSPFTERSLVHYATSWHLRWRDALGWAREYQAGNETPQLPSELRHPGALIGLGIGLLVRQAALAGEHGWPPSTDER